MRTRSAGFASTILCSRKQGSAPTGNTIEKIGRDQYYRLFSPACRTTAVPSLPSKPAQTRRASPMRSTMHTQPRAGILSLCGTDSRRLRVPAASRRTKASETCPFIQGCQERHSRLTKVPIKQKARPASRAFLLPRGRHHQPLPGRRKHEFLGGVSQMGEMLRVGEIGHAQSNQNRA